MATTKRTPKGSNSTQPAKPVMPKGARPVTCGELYEFDPKANGKFAAEGCGRLPRHNGDHRATLTASAKPKRAAKRAAKPKVTAKRWTREGLALFRAELEDKAASGELTFGEALSRLARAQDAYRAQRTRRPKAQPKAETVA